MKKIWLLTTLLVAWLLLTGCNKTVVENCWDDCINESDIDVLEHKCMEYVNNAMFYNIEASASRTNHYFYDNSWSMEYTFTDAQFLWTYYWIKWYTKAWDKSQNFICNIYTGWWLHDLYFYNDKSNNEEPVTEEVNIPSFEELEDVVAMCPYEVMWWWYSEYPVYKREFIIPYKDWYIWYNYWWNWWWWGYYLTYKSLDKPCEIISYTDEFFYRHVHYKHDLEEYNEYEYPDNKVYLSQW
jgi:hypothetical protein